MRASTILIIIITTASFCMADQNGSEVLLAGSSITRNFVVGAIIGGLIGLMQSLFKKKE